jgi:hypothetical protein
MQSIVSLLNDDCVVGIFPEGHVSTTGELSDLKRGFEKKLPHISLTAKGTTTTLSLDSDNIFSKPLFKSLNSPVVETCPSGKIPTTQSSFNKLTMLCIAFRLFSGLIDTAPTALRIQLNTGFL